MLCFEQESPNRTIFASGGLGLLQMVSEPDIERCSSEEAEFRRRCTRDDVPARTLGPKWGWIGEVPHRLEKGTSANKDVGPQRVVDCEIPYQLGRRTKHSS